MTNIEDIPIKEWEELIRVSSGKRRIESECKHEGIINAIDGCEFCGASIIKIPGSLIKQLHRLSEYKIGVD